MSSYDNTNRGLIAKNDRKATEKHPDIKGSLNVDGVDYWLDGWLRENERGKFYSLSVKPKDAKPQGDSAATIGRFKDAVKKSFPDDDQIPF